MKRILSFSGALLLGFLALAAPVYAVVKSNDTVIVKAEEVIDDDFFAAGSEVIIEGTVNGDVYVAANRLAVRGTVNGDVIAAANNIEVTGIVRDDLRAGGNNISLIGARIGDSVSVGGNELSIDSDTRIGGGLLFGGRSLSLDGSIGRGIMSGDQSARINGPVAGTVRIAVDNLTIGEDAVIRGDLEYRSDNDAVINGKILGEVTKNEGLNLSTEGVLRGFVVAFNIWAFLAALVIGGVLMLLFPSMFRRAHERFTKKPWPAIGWGTLFLLATLPAVIILMITVIGIPLALILALLWVLAMLFAKFFVGYTVGFSLLKYFKKTDAKFVPKAYWALALGLTLYYLLRLLPYVGILVRLVTTIIGIALMLTLYKRPKTKKA